MPKCFGITISFPYFIRFFIEIIPKFTLSPTAPDILLQHNLKKCLTSDPLQMSKSFQATSVYYLHNIVLDIYNSFDFQIPNFLLSWFSCCPQQKIHLYLLLKLLVIMGYTQVKLLCSLTPHHHFHHSPCWPFSLLFHSLVMCFLLQTQIIIIIIFRRILVNVSLNLRVP